MTSLPETASPWSAASPATAAPGIARITTSARANASPIDVTVAVVPSATAWSPGRRAPQMTWGPAAGKARPRIPPMKPVPMTAISTPRPPVDVRELFHRVSRPGRRARTTRSIRRTVRDMGRRDEHHAMEHFAAARDMLRFESERLSNIFSAFLLADTVLMGFVLHAATRAGGFPGEPGTALVGGVVGLCVSGLWLAAYERIASTLEMRMARARETEPDGWELLTGRPHSFDRGHAEVFDGEDAPRRVTGLARLEIRNAARLLVALFIVAYATIAVWGFVDAIN